MGKITKEEVFQILSIVITVMLSVFNSDTDDVVIFPIVGIFIGLVVFSLIYNRVKANKNLSNTAVIAKSKKHTKLLKKLIKANGKVLKKYSDVRGFKRLEKSYKKVLRKVNGRVKTNDYQLEKLRIKFESNWENYYSKENIKKKYKAIKKELPYCTEQQAYDVYKIVYKNIKDLRRILLQLEQHELRIKLGKYVVKYSFDINEQINSYIDDIGWTHVLLGDNKKGTEAVQMAINLIDYRIFGSKTLHLSDKDKREQYLNLQKKLANLSDEEKNDHYKFLMLKARALRHLGTTYYTYKTVGQKVKNYLREAMDIVTEEGFKNYYLYTSKDTKKTYYSMIQGIEYNMMLYEYYEYLEKRDLSDSELIKMYKRADKMLEELMELKKEDLYDKHRYVKLLTFRSQIYNEIMDPKFKLEHENTVEQDLKNIETILNGNVYFDEALEAYLQQKVEKVYNDVNEVFNK